MSQTLQKYIERLYGGEIKNVVYYPDGAVCPDVSFREKHIYSGSFNPLHAGHRSIFDAMPTNESIFEYSIFRKGKEPHSVDHIINNIIRQFQWYAPIVVTNAATFLDKIYYLNASQCTFHIGYDTFERVVSDYGFGGCHLIPANFTVYDRVVDNIKYSLDNYSNPPANFTKGTLLNPVDISSTKLREVYGQNPT